VSRHTPLILSLLLLASCAHAPEPWTPGQKVLLGTYTALQAADALQTRATFRDDRFVENNPFICKIHEAGGEAAVMAYFAGTWAFVAGAAHYLPPDQRTAWLSIFSLVQLGFVANNLSVGIGIPLP
jgi:hypothetical protein